MYLQTKDRVSVLFYNQLSQDISHAILHEKEEAYQQLMGGNFETSREGQDVFLKIASEKDLLHVRAITQLPVFIKF